MNLPQEASDDMLQQPHCLNLNKTSNHVAQDCTDSVEAFIGGANVAQTSVVQKDFLHDENGYCL